MATLCRTNSKTCLAHLHFRSCVYTRFHLNHIKTVEFVPPTMFGQKCGCHGNTLYDKLKKHVLHIHVCTKGPISLAETSLRLPRLISRGNSGDSGDQKMACALTKETSPRLISRGDSGDQRMACALTKATPGRRPKRLRDVSRQGDNQFARKSRGRRHDVSGSRRNVSSVSSRSRRRCGDVVETSAQSRTKLVSATSPQLMETSPRPAGDWKKSPQKSNMFEFPATPRRPG